MSLITLFLLLISSSESYTEDSVIATIVTNPIVFGEDVTFKCLFADSRSSLTTRWLIEPDKVCITDGNVSTNETKYKPMLYKKGPGYIYTLTLHNSSFTDLGTYICEVGFQSTLITFAINRTLPFIYIPSEGDVVFNQTDVEPIFLNIWIRKIYPIPYCTFFYKEEHITGTIKHSNDLESRVYSVKMEIFLDECGGSLNISCRLGSRYFTIFNYIQECCKGKECNSTKNFNATTFALGILMISLVILVTVCLASLMRHKTRKAKWNSENSKYQCIPS